MNKREMQPELWDVVDDLQQAVAALRREVAVLRDVLMPELLRRRLADELMTAQLVNAVEGRVVSLTTIVSRVVAEVEERRRPAAE